MTNLFYCQQHYDSTPALLLEPQALQRLVGNHQPLVIDLSSAGNYSNAHIPGAMYEPAGITKDKQIISYCQTHHRSAHSYIALKSLGYQNIKGYPGAWSEGGNDANTPIEQ